MLVRGKVATFVTKIYKCCQFYSMFQVFFQKPPDAAVGPSAVATGVSTFGVDRVDAEEHVSVMQADSGFAPRPGGVPLDHAHLREQYTR